MIQIEEFDENRKQDSVKTRPLIIKWKTVPMIRSHSLKASVKEILEFMKNRDVVKIGIVGDQSTGKTSLGDTLGHLVHKMSDIPFAVRSFGKEEFLNMEKTLKSLEPANYILKFSDLSFLSAVATKKELDVVKQVITVIRHLREDVKIILIYDYHYTLGLDKYLRQADFRYFTSIGSSEVDNVLNIVKDKYKGRIERFRNLCVEMSTKGTASFQFNRNMPKFVYSYKNPFVLCLFWNEMRLRYVIFPLRTWIDPICPTCSIGDDLPTEVNIEKFIQEATDPKKFPKKVFEIAVKLKAFSNGLNVYSPKVVQALRYIDRALEKKQIPLEALLAYYGLNVTKTRLRVQLDGVLADEAITPEKTNA